MSLLDKSQLAQHSEFRDRIKVAALKTAILTKQDSERESEWPYCNFILREPENSYWLNQLAYSVVVYDTDISTESSDEEIETAVENVFTNFSTTF